MVRMRVISVSWIQISLSLTSIQRQYTMRDKSGRFVKGYSGNAGNRPKDEHNIAELARSYSTEAIDTLVDLMRSAKDDRMRGTAVSLCSIEVLVSRR
jgi:hypothetical protein